ncbi:MAG: hypothetical protein A2808_03595 [Candidatus Moranbacteria bacterium RIFCSPHIGHO2_01_FULL_55_24]|nr:MAG: hypothetical protein A2808_03595 [Candidatus Moranbacteria bacterium RIFCSPHIGHO2_01_FULL_55_24]
MFETALFWIFLLLPFQFALSPASGIDFALIRVAIPLLFLAWLASGLTKRSLNLPSPFLFSILLFFAAFSFLSMFWASEPGWAFRKASFLANFLLLFPILWDVAEEKYVRMRLAKGVVLGAFVAACIGIFQFFLQFIVGVETLFRFWTNTLLPFFLGENFASAVATYPSLLVNVSGETLMRATAFFPDPHLFSLFMAISAFLSLGIFMENRKTFWAIVFGILTLAVLLAFSRGGYLALFGGGTLLGFFRMREHFSLRTFLICFLGVLAFLGIFSTTPVGTRFFESFSLEEGSNRARLLLWGEALEHIRERPLLGTGLGNYPLAVKPEATYREPIYAHNLFLDLTLELGFIGLLAFILLPLMAIFGSYKVRKDPLVLGYLGALTAFLVHSFFETPIYSVHVFPLYLLVLAALMRSGKGRVSPRKSEALRLS